MPCNICILHSICQIPCPAHQHASASARYACRSGAVWGGGNARQLACMPAHSPAVQAAEGHMKQPSCHHSCSCSRLAAATAGPLVSCAAACEKHKAAWEDVCMPQSQCTCMHPKCTFAGPQGDSNVPLSLGSHQPQHRNTIRAPPSMACAYCKAMMCTGIISPCSCCHQCLPNRARVSLAWAAQVI